MNTYRENCRIYINYSKISRKGVSIKKLHDIENSQKILGCLWVYLKHLIISRLIIGKYTV